MTRRKTVGWLVLTTLLASGSGRAQAPPARPLPDETAANKAASDEVMLEPEPSNTTGKPPRTTLYETATVSARPLDSATGSISVVEAEEIDSLVALGVNETLDFVPGVSLASASRGSLQAAEIRGGDPNFTLVLVDGVPLNDPTDALGGAFNLASFTVTGLERVEVSRGPASAVYGSSALAGVIQLFTRAGGDRLGLSVEVDGGDHDLRRGGAAAGGPLNRHTRGSIAVASERESGRIGSDRFDLLAVLGGLDFEANSATRLRLRTRSSRWQADDYPPGSGGPRLGLGLLRSSDHSESSLSTQLDFGSKPSVQHQATATYYRHDVERSSPPLPPLIPPSNEDTRFDQLRLLFASTFQVGDSRLAFGAEAEHQQGRNTSLLLLPQFLGGPIAGDYSRSRDQGGVFTEGLRTWGGPWGNLTIEAGARIDFPDGVSTQASPRFGIALRPGELPMRVRASLGRAFKQPSFNALESPPQLGGNPALRPETSWGADLGLDFDPLRSLSGSLTLFSNRYRDLIDFDFLTFRLVNRDRVSASGAELALLWSPLRTLQIDLVATAQDVEDQTTRLALLRRAERFGAIKLTLRPASALAMVIDLRHSGPRFDQQVGAERRLLEGHDLLGAAVTWSVSPRWQLRLRLDNLTSERYENEIGLPGAERAARIGIRFAR